MEIFDLVVSDPAVVGAGGTIAGMLITWIATKLKYRSELEKAYVNQLAHQSKRIDDLEKRLDDREKEHRRQMDEERQRGREEGEAMRREFEERIAEITQPMVVDH